MKEKNKPIDGDGETDAVAFLHEGQVAVRLR